MRLGWRRQGENRMTDLCTQGGWGGACWEAPPPYPTCPLLPYLPLCRVTPPPPHLDTRRARWKGEDKDPAESRTPGFNKLPLGGRRGGGLTCMQEINALYPRAHVHMCVRVCVCLKCRRRLDLFPVKSRSPHNKGPRPGES